MTIGYGSGSTATAAVGTYSGTVTPSAATGGSFVAGNYTITYPTGNIAITPASLLITAEDNAKCVGQEVVLAGNAFRSSGLVNNDAVSSVSLTSTGAASGATAGEYSIIPSGAVGATGTALSNYEISYANGSLSVTSAALLMITNPAGVCSPGTVDLTASAITSGSTAGLTYTYWTNEAATTAYATPRAATSGTYYIKGTTVAGCYDIKPVTVSYNTAPVVAITNPSPVCSPATVDLTATAVTTGSTSGLNYTYWTNAGATTSYSTPAAATAGTYYIKGTSSAGCYDIQPVTVTVNAIPTVEITNPANICFGSTADLTASAITSGSTASLTYTYWSNAGATTAYATPAAATAGTYYIKGSTTAGCYDIKPVTVTADPVAVGGTLAGGTTPIILGRSTGIITLSGQSGTIVKWQKRLGSGSWVDINNTSASLLDSPYPYGTWEFRAAVQSGACSAVYSTSRFIEVLDSNPGAVVGGTTPICNGSSTGTLTLTDYTESILKWQKRLDGGSWTDISNTNATYSEIPTSVGTWQYRGVTHGLTDLYSTAVSIVVNPVMPVSVTIGATATSVPAGTAVTFTATPTNEGASPSYQWKVNGVNVGTSSATYAYKPVYLDAVSCVLTSSIACTSGSPATSNSVSMTVTTAPFNLSTGWTWFSVNVWRPDMSIGTVLGNLVPKQGDYIKSQTSSATYYTGTGWFGNLSTIDPKQMYKIKLNTADVLRFSGYPVDLNANPITINSGWNWIGYLPQYAQTVTRALASTSRVENDYIKDLVTSTTYLSPGGWFGTMSQMVPNGGYMVKAKNASTLVYAEGDPMKLGTVQSSGPGGTDFKPESFEFSGQITATVYLNGMNYSSEDYCLFSMVNGTIRGVSQGMWFEPGNEWLHSHLTYSNMVEGDTVRFRLYDAAAESWYDFKEYVVFQADMVIANAFNPFKLQNSSLLVPSALILEPSLSVWPNPASNFATIHYIITDDQPVIVQIVDYSGRIVDELDLGKQTRGEHVTKWDTRMLNKGVYHLRLKNAPSAYQQVIITR